MTSFSERLNSFNYQDVSPPDQNSPANYFLSRTTSAPTSLHQHTEFHPVNLGPHDPSFDGNHSLPPAATVSTYSEYPHTSIHRDTSLPTEDVSPNHSPAAAAPASTPLHLHDDPGQQNLASSSQSTPNVYLPPPTTSTPSFAKRLNFPVPPPPSDDLFTSAPSSPPIQQRHVSSPATLPTHNKMLTVPHPSSSIRQQITPSPSAVSHPPWTSSIPQPLVAAQQQNVLSPLVLPYPAPVSSSQQSRAPSVPSQQPLAPRTSILSPTVPSPYFSEPVAPSSPTAEQLSNLQNRYNLPSASTIRRRPVPGAQNSLGYPNPTAPRAAVGRRSASVNTSAPLPQSTMNRSNSHGSSRSALNSMGRSNSRGSACSASSSTPNFRRPPPPVSLNRLETIQSVASTNPMSRTTPAEPSRSRSRGEVSSVGTVLPKRNPSRAEKSAAINIKEAKKRGWGSGGKQRRKKGGSVWGGGSEWTDETGGSSDGEGKTGGKCAVM
ncbi:MAG: hypothetical protein M1835_006826 [Candelina submexicana]|nr:MAG: hypothetical protein M1835_006826 [Candelina submexicana]